ncbi:MAG: histidine phosphatase family protein [Nanoarchaeota archaeon]|nr:histidine phosphatase family protein [Nanoarchaeota archaeon]
MKIYIIRHAQSKRNAKMESKEDAELTEVGEEQARRLGEFFHDVNLDRIYCSPLKRAKTTLEKIKHLVKDVPISYSKKIIEIKMGKYGKGGKDDWRGYFKEAVESGVPYHLHRPKGGESLQECYNRAGKFYLSLLKKHSGKDSILLVGHGFFSMYLILNALGLYLFEGKYYQLSNASVSTLEIDKNAKIKNFHVNDYHHLIRAGMKMKGVK